MLLLIEKHYLYFYSLCCIFFLTSVNSDLNLRLQFSFKLNLNDDIEYRLM